MYALASPAWLNKEREFRRLMRTSLLSSTTPRRAALPQRTPRDIGTRRIACVRPTFRLNLNLNASTHANTAASLVCCVSSVYLCCGLVAQYLATHRERVPLSAHQHRCHVSTSATRQYADTGRNRTTLSAPSPPFLHCTRPSGHLIEWASAVGDHRRRHRRRQRHVYSGTFDAVPNPPSFATPHTRAHHATAASFDAHR